MGETMESYTGFAGVYDELMDATPYEEWCQRIVDYIEKYGVSRPVHAKTDEGGAGKCQNGREDHFKVSDGEKGAEKPPEARDEKNDREGEREIAYDEQKTLREALESEKNLVLDLGCGTGTLTELMARRGYDMIGIDLSSEMLLLALEKKEASRLDIMYFCQDMRELDMYSTIGTIYSVCDSINYLLEDEDVIQCFKQVDMFLFPKGLFLFDFNTVYKYEQIGDSVIAESREDCSFIWDNYYDPDTHTNEYDLTIYQQKEGDLYRRFDETHVQRGYTLEEMKGFLKEAGLEFIEAVDGDTGGEVTEISERIFVAAREKDKDISLSEEEYS
ncbi:MAG: class I SAM-dependent methyltransferase [Lachnospiraceae bacterium]|nr:class I SAM-dependent methyltransferase [Lachnospiraceae bacterium]